MGEADTEALIHLYTQDEVGMRNLAAWFHITYNEVRRILIENKVKIRRRGRPST